MRGFNLGSSRRQIKRRCHRDYVKKARLFHRFNAARLPELDFGVMAASSNNTSSLAALIASNPLAQAVSSGGVSLIVCTPVGRSLLTVNHPGVNSSIRVISRVFGCFPSPRRAE